jgi:hypothetical protein
VLSCPLNLRRYATAAVRVAGVCRRINSVLTCESARENLNVEGAEVESILNDLRVCYDEFEELKKTPSGIMSQEVATAFCDGWKVCA